MGTKTTLRTRSSIATLDEVRKYHNIDIIERFMESWDLSLEASTEIFDEMKNWLWLCANTAKRQIAGEKVPELAISNSMILLDEMWHAFILFTKQYTSFCNTYFGFYIHHGPTTSEQKDSIKVEIEKNPEEYLRKIEEDLTFQYEYIYEQLGESTLKKWYSEWTDLYTPEHLNELYKKQW